MARETKAQRRQREYEEFMALPLVEPSADRLRGPELGARVRLTTGSYAGEIGTVTRRYYVWSPDKLNGSGTRGFPRLDDSVVDFDSGKSMVVLDKDLEVIA